MKRAPLKRKPVTRGYWTCQRRRDGVRCRKVNPNRKRKCEACGSPKPPKRQPKHMVALELPYEYYVEINNGERCGICLRPRGEKDRRRFHRDHDHRTGRPRGLLCFPCNKRLSYDWTPELLRAAADYLERTL